MGQWYNWQLQLHYHHVWWVVLQLKRVTKILFSPKKHFKIGRCSKLYIHLKTELSQETRLPEIIPTTKHMLCDIVSCQYHWVQLSTLAKMTSSPGSSRGSNMVKGSWSFSHGLVWWSFNESGNHSTGHRLGYWSTARRRILHIPL